jgi:hypothetical protein
MLCSIWRWQEIILIIPWFSFIYILWGNCLKHSTNWLIKDQEWEATWAKRLYKYLQLQARDNRSKGRGRSEEHMQEIRHWLEWIVGKMGLKWMSLILGFLAIQFLGGLLCMARGDVLHYDFVVSTSFPFFFFLN